MKKKPDTSTIDKTRIAILTAAIRGARQAFAAKDYDNVRYWLNAVNIDNNDDNGNEFAASTIRPWNV